MRTLDVASYHVNVPLPSSGGLTIPNVCNDALETFKTKHAAEGARNSTINRSLEVARTALDRAARGWRTNGKPWLLRDHRRRTHRSASSCAGLDLRHTFGQRLRDAGVTEEDRDLLLGHAVTGMPQLYATATIARLVEAANKVRETRDRTTLPRVVNG